MEQTGLTQKYGSSWPGVSAVGKVVTEIRNRDMARPSELKQLDEPWSLASLDKNPIPPEVIPIVLDIKQNWPVPPNFSLALLARIQKEFEDWDTERALWVSEQIEEGSPSFTVRKAKWSARIAPVLKNKLTPQGIGWWGQLYADFERVCEIAGIQFDTSSLDSSLLIGDIRAYILWSLAPTSIDRGKKIAQDIERKNFRHILEDIELTRLGWALYRTWLTQVTYDANKWPSLSIEEREDFVKRLRAWVIEREPVEEIMYPDELLAEVDYTMFLGKTPVGQKIGGKSK